MLAQLHRLRGDPAAAAEAAQRRALLEQLPPEVVAANSLYADGDLAPAETVIRAYLRNDPANAGAWRLLARLRIEQDGLDEAEALLRALLQRAPDYHEARLDYAIALLQGGKPLEARRQAERLLAHDPDDRDHVKQYAAACVALGDHEPVIDLYARLLAAGCKTPAEAADLHLWRANALKVAGRQAEAVADYRASLAARPDNGVAWFSLANLKTYRFTDAEIARMQAAQAAILRTDVLAGEKMPPVPEPGLVGHANFDVGLDIALVVVVGALLLGHQHNKDLVLQHLQHVPGTLEQLVHHELL